MKPALIIVTSILMFMMLAGVAPADTIIMKNGIRHESESVFNMAGAWYYKVNGKVLSVPEEEVDKVVKGSVPPPAESKPGDAAAPPSPADPATPEAGPTAAVVDKAQEAIRKANWQFIRDCRIGMETEAKRSKSDYKATCAKAVLMVERMYEGNMPADGTFGYYREKLYEKLLWDILPEAESAKLNKMILKDDGPFLKFEKLYLRRTRIQAAKDLRKGEEILRMQREAAQRQKELVEAEARERLKNMPRQQPQPNGYFNSHAQYHDPNEGVRRMQQQQAREQQARQAQTRIENANRRLDAANRSREAANRQREAARQRAAARRR